MHRRWTARFLPFLVLLATSPAPAIQATPEGEEPDRVVVQHCLIGFKRSISGKKIARTKKEAAALARSLLERAREGEPFEGIVKEYTDDSFPGIFVLANKGMPIRAGERIRSDMVPGFGDVAFSLEVGEFGMATYHGYKSPYGWHIILRLE